MPRGRPKKQPDAQTQQSGAQTGGEEKGKRINKMDCVRQALDELGNDAQPKDIEDFLKRKFRLDMNTKFISTYKGTILRKAARNSDIMRRPAATAPAEVPAPPKASLQVAATNGGISVEDIRVVKELVGRIGADNLRELADVLAQ